MSRGYEYSLRFLSWFSTGNRYNIESWFAHIEQRQCSGWIYVDTHVGLEYVRKERRPDAVFFLFSPRKSSNYRLVCHCLAIRSAAGWQPASSIERCLATGSERLNA